MENDLGVDDVGDDEKEELCDSSNILCRLVVFYVRFDLAHNL